MLRFGIISELGEDENLGFARVSFDENAIVSGWLPLPSLSTATAKRWDSIAVNSQVACTMDTECEQGVISTALWSNTDTPPEWANANTSGVLYADGTAMYYDAENGKLTLLSDGATFVFDIKGKAVSLEAEDFAVAVKCKTANVEASDTIGLKCTTLNVDGEVKIKGDTTITGNLDASGNIKSKGEISTLTVKLSTHMHPTAGTGPPSPPTPGT